MAADEEATRQFVRHNWGQASPRLMKMLALLLKNKQVIDCAESGHIELHFYRGKQGEAVKAKIDHPLADQEEVLEEQYTHPDRAVSL